MNTDEIVSVLAGVSVGSFTLLSLLSVIVLFLFCLIAIKIIMKIMDGILGRSKMDAALKSFIRSGIKTGLWIITIIMIAEKLGIPTASLVALLGVAGLALSLSIQGIVSNLFSGITILATRPFTADDYVELDNVSGTVTKVGLFYTTITTIDNKLIYIPNSQVTNAKIINYTREKNRRVDLVFCASYDDSTEVVKTALMDAVLADGRAMSDPAPFVGLSAYKGSSIEYAVRVWVKRDDYWDVHFALNESVRELFNERGIQMTYDHLNVHVVKD
ncbi:MAG: mechanosensitive ion channel family protein [Oscillospiraceae bacterium]